MVALDDRPHQRQPETAARLACRLAAELEAKSRAIMFPSKDITASDKPAAATATSAAEPAPKTLIKAAETAQPRQAKAAQAADPNEDGLF